MGNFKRVKLFIESEGYMNITCDEDLNNWEESITDENVFKLKRVEVLEEYDLPQHLLDYVKSNEFDNSLDDEMELFISSERKRMTRDKKIDSVIS